MFQKLFSKSIPKIKIIHGKLIDPIFIFYCQNSPELKDLGWNAWTPPSPEEIKLYIQKYRDAWRPYEREILSAITKKLNLRFREPFIKAYIVSGNPRQMSAPLIIKSGYNQEDFVATLTHELIHILLEENADKIIANYTQKFTANEFTKSTRNHILLFATLSFLYTEILLKPDYIEKLKLNSKKHSTDDYTKAWEIVEGSGYIKILNIFNTQCKK